LLDKCSTLEPQEKVMLSEVSRFRKTKVACFVICGR
jgi:hypothetical protein